MSAGATFTIHPFYYETRLAPHIDSENDVCFEIDNTCVRGSGELVEAASDYLRKKLSVTSVTENHSHRCKRLKFEMCQQSLLMFLQLLSDGHIHVRRPAYCLKLIEALLTLHIDFVENLQVETDNLDLSKFLTNTSYLDLGKLREYYEKSGRVMSCKFCSYWTVSDIALEFHESKCSVLLLDQVIGNVGRLTPAGTKGKRVKQISVGTAFEKKVTKMELDQ